MAKISIAFDDVDAQELQSIIELLQGKNGKTKKKTVLENDDEDEDEEEEEQPKPKKAVKKAKPEPEEEDEDEDEDEEEEESEGYTQDRVREKCQQLIEDGKAAKLKTLLTEFGAAKVVNLKPKDFDKFMAKANKIK